MHETYRGPSPGSAKETDALLKALVGDPTRYRTVAALNLHSFGNHLMATEGFSSGFSPCTVDTNCTAPDLGVFHMLAGTERAPFLTDEETGRPYITRQVFRGLYEVSGDSATETHYGTLDGAPQFVSVSTEMTRTECGQRMEQVPGWQIDSLYANSFRPWIDHVVSQADELESAMVPDFSMPILHRRQVSGTGAEFPTARVAVRTDLGPATITGDVSGTASVDDVLDGVYYTEWRWRPDGDPYTFPPSLTVCVDDIGNCRTARLEDPDKFSLCDSSRWTVGSGWSFIGDAAGGPQDECFWRFTGSGSSPWSLTSTQRDLTKMTEARLVYSYRWVHGVVDKARVVVSSNGFTSCTATNWGNCRIVRIFPYSSGISNVDARDEQYRTDIVDVADFDGKSGVQVRFQVDSSNAVSMNEFTVHDPVFIGWEL